MITSWQPISNSFCLFTFFSRALSPSLYLRTLFFILFCFVSFTTLRICVLQFVCGPIRIFGVSKCAHAFDFNRLNSTLRRYVSQQNNCKGKNLFAIYTSLFVIQTNFVAVAVAVFAYLFWNLFYRKRNFEQHFVCYLSLCFAAFLSLHSNK